MDVNGQITVFFDDPFWVGVYERGYDNLLEVSKIVFGEEPKDYQVYYFLLENWWKLRFGVPIDAENKEERKISPKRMQRAISRQLSQTGVSTKAQQAMKLQHEQKVIQRKAVNKRRTEEEEQFKFELKQQKKKEKHKGR